MSESVTLWTVARQVPQCEISQARALERAAFSSPTHKACRCVRPSAVSDSLGPWTVAHQAPLSMGFSSQEYWSGLPCPSPGDLPDSRIEPVCLVSHALAGGFFTAESLLKF